MPAQRKSTRQRLVQAALQLFAAQGVTETTTRQIAELADVNEVTLFRHFGSKHGLLLAVIEEAEVFTQLGETLGQKANQRQGVADAVRTYVDGHLQALEQIPEFIRSLVGEAGNYPTENREAIGRGLSQVHRYTVQYLTTVTAQAPQPLPLPPAKLASLINTLLLGYAVIEFTTEFHDLWPDRQAFITDVVTLFLLAEGETVELTDGDQLPALTASDSPNQGNGFIHAQHLDLAAPLVREILQAARKSGPQDYALVYVLFGAGLNPTEVAGLGRSHSIYNNQQHILQITRGAVRQVPLNQWIMGYRYGSYSKNPLTQWLKVRKDDQTTVLLNETGRTMSEVEVRLRWQEITAAIVTPTGQAPQIEQAKATWCVEMLSRGMPPEGLCLISGWAPDQLQPYVQRARQKAALEQAIQLDQRPSSKPEALP